MAWLLLAVVLLSLPAPLASADDFSPPAAAAVGPCGRIDDGQRVRVQLADGQTLEASFAGCRDDTLLFLAPDGPRAISLASTTAIWARARQTDVGMGLGAAVGGVLGGLALYALAGMGDVNPLPVALVGVSFGAIAGGLSGALVGSAAACWRQVYGSDQVDAPRVDDVIHAPSSPSGRIGSFGVAAGGAWADDVAPGDGGLSLSAALTADYPSGFAIGVEFASAQVGSPPGYPATPGYTPEQRVWLLGVVARYGRRTGPVIPYATAGFSHYQWEEIVNGLSVGAGVALPLRENRWTARAEYRYHEKPGYHALMAGLTYGW